MGFPFDADASQAKDDGPKHIPAGDYEFKVIDLPAHSITSTNRNMLTMKMVIQDGEYSGRKIRWNLVFLTKDHEHHGMTVKALKAFGLEYDGALNIEPSDFQDKLVRAHVTVKNEKFIPKGATEAITVPKSEIGWFILDDDNGSQASSSPKAAAKKEEDEVPF